MVRGDALIHCAKEFLLGTKADQGRGVQGRIKVSGDPWQVGPVRGDGPVNVPECADDRVLSASLLQAVKEGKVGFMHFVFGKPSGTGPVTRYLLLLVDPERLPEGSVVTMLRGSQPILRKGLKFKDVIP